MIQDIYHTIFISRTIFFIDIDSGIPGWLLTFYILQNKVELPILFASLLCVALRKYVNMPSFIKSRWLKPELLEYKCRHSTICDSSLALTHNLSTYVSRIPQCFLYSEAKLDYNYWCAIKRISVSISLLLFFL